MANVESKVAGGRSLMEAESRTEKLYRRLLALFSICAIGGSGIVSISQILWRQPFSLTKPDFHGALSAGLMGLGLVFGSFHMYMREKSKENPKLPGSTSYLMLLLVGVLELCFACFFVYSNLKAIGY